jgi:hypothetical protein
MITAEQFLEQNGDEDFRLSKSGLYVSDMMIKFAKLHVEEALKKASEKASHNHTIYDKSFIINKESILNAYNIEENIK